MLFLPNPFLSGTKIGSPLPKRSRKTPGALYRILREEFERLRPHECSCKMPMLFECERDSPDGPNWSVETLWCGCRDCQRALAEVVTNAARHFDLKETGEALANNLPPLARI